MLKELSLFFRSWPIYIVKTPCKKCNELRLLTPVDYFLSICHTFGEMVNRWNLYCKKRKPALIEKCCSGVGWGPHWAVWDGIMYIEQNMNMIVTY